MNDPTWTLAGGLYIPLVLALLAGIVRGRRPRQFASCLLSVLWALPSLLVVQRLNQWAGWWTFSGGDYLLSAMPLELYFGWVLLWGILPQLAFQRLPIKWCAAIMVALDLIAMPLCKPVVQLGPEWLLGEMVAALLVLIPALCIARWTLENTHLRARAAMQTMIAGMLFLFLVPELVIGGWQPLLQLPGWFRQLGFQLLVLLAIPGIGAVVEFAERGGGTPIPYDPPQRLVTSGIYRYCANPMQFSCALVMLLWAGLLSSGWLLIAAFTSIIYSAGIAEWDEGQDLARRFGPEWKQYRAQVRSWLFRWRPYHAGPAARLYIAATCGPCRELRSWLEARQPLGLEIIDAETLPAGSIRRLRYDPNDGSHTVDGVRAMGRALEHLNLAWALSGTALRLPIIWQSIQLLMDASGLGPRTPRKAF